MPAPSDQPRDVAPANSTQPPSFEEGLAQLADIVNRLEGGGLGLTESIAAYERGVVILRGLHEELARAEERIRLLTAVTEDGQPISEPFPGAHDGTTADPTANGSGDKVGRRPASRPPAQRKAPRSPTLPGMDDSTAEA
ncbi:MAG: exodeoxyribonuclease VII small subunit [Planctomycetia bacterium]